MNRDTAGFAEQMVTTWGSDVQNGIVVGQTQPMQWVCKCRCGKECKGSGYGTLSSVRAFKWEIFSDEAFCSLKCAGLFRREEVWQAYLQGYKVTKAVERRLGDMMTAAFPPPNAKS
jgi:hypothetical protein